MQDDELKSYEATQAEMRELGLSEQTEEKTEEEKSPGESDEEKDEPEEKESKSEEDEEESEEDEEESEDDKSDEDSDKSDDDKSEDEKSEDDEDHRPKQVSIREHKEMKKQLREEIKTLKDELNKKTPSDTKVTTISERAKKLSAKLGFDEEKTQLILEEARDAALEEFQSKSTLSDEDKKVFETIKHNNFLAEQEKIFNSQWEKTLPAFKAQYPNATPEQIMKAREEMDTLAHSEKFHTYEMDYILFKNKDIFEKVLFSPKQKTFESSRPSISTNDDSEEFPDFNPDWTPAQVEVYEKKMASYSSGKEKTKVTGLNQRTGKTETRDM